MRLLRWLGSIVVVATIFARALHAEPRPDAATIQKLIEAMREGALAYDSRLPDFICTQVTHREVRREAANQTQGITAGRRGGGGTGSMPATDTSWKPVDTIEEQLTYFSHRETYKLVATNGKKAGPDEQPEPGAASSGEFGSTLSGIFDPASHADFNWKRWDKVRGQPVYVFTFSIAKENSTAQLVAGRTKLIVAYHGLIFAERESNTILRLTTEAEIPPDFPLQHVIHELDYGPAMIAGERFVLPLHGEMQSQASESFINSGQMLGGSPLVSFRNRIDFKGYRKYGVDAVLKPE